MGRRHTRSGQAIAELVTGLIAIVVLIMGILLIQTLSRAHTQTLNQARAQAGQDAIQDPYILRYSVPSWISDWNTGRDKLHYSQDDQQVAGNPNTITAGVIARAQPSDLSAYAPGNEISAAANAGGLLDNLFLTHGREQETIDLARFPIIRHIVYGADAITMQGDAWLAWAHIENVK
jgi:hypothetical protein